jgi:ribA/ribD-fused uncharacterized protein
MVDKYHLFFGGAFSQWAPSKFVIDDVTYNCAEQYMMAEKARLFKDDYALRSIMDTHNPAKQKQIGRNVQNFDEIRWNNIARLVVYRGNLAKFTQNENFRDFMLGTKDQVIVEASPYDKIWGIGLDEFDPDAKDESKWKGTNWLGIALMQVRSDIRNLVRSDVARMPMDE